MFQGLFRRAESTIDNAVWKLVGRAAVAVPLLIASGFASAALTVWLVERYGAITAYGMMAALFSFIALVTMAVVSTNGPRVSEEAPAQSASSAETSADTAADEGIDPMDLLTPEVRAFLATAAPMAIPVVARGVGRNLPLIFLLAVVGYLISRFATGDGSEQSEQPPAAAEQGGEDMQENVAANAAA
jgi:uncharacterized membrane protein